MPVRNTPIRLVQIAELVGGDVVGDGSVELTGAAIVRDAQPGDLTFLVDAAKLARLEAGSATAAIVPRGVVAERCPVVQVDDVIAGFSRVVLYFRPGRVARRHGVSPHASVSASARLAVDVDVHPGAVIDDDVEIGRGSTIHSGACLMAGCRLGENVTVFPRAVLYENTEVAPRTIIHAGAVLGAYGFGYSTVEGRHKLSAQLGYVRVGADVEIGANTTIDRGTFGPTVIGDGTKIDNQVMIAHNCRLGKHNLICSQVGIAGSTTTGDYVVMAGQAGVRDHVHIGTGATLGAKCGVMNDVPDGATMLGSPAIPDRVQMLQFAAVGKLPETRKAIRKMAATIADLEERIHRMEGRTEGSSPPSAAA